MKVREIMNIIVVRCTWLHIGYTTNGIREGERALGQLLSNLVVERSGARRGCSLHSLNKLGTSVAQFLTFLVVDDQTEDSGHKCLLCPWRKYKQCASDMGGRIASSSSDSTFLAIGYHLTLSK